MERAPTPPVGWEYVAEPDPGWRVLAGRHCRWGAGYKTKACGRPSVAEFDRSRPGRRAIWWAYCEQHLYGRWVENGRVYRWILRKVEP